MVESTLRIQGNPRVLVERHQCSLTVSTPLLIIYWPSLSGKDFLYRKLPLELIQLFVLKLHSSCLFFDK
jgi:hypothetical protein